MTGKVSMAADQIYREKPAMLEAKTKCCQWCTES